MVLVKFLHWVENNAHRVCHIDGAVDRCMTIGLQHCTEKLADSLQQVGYNLSVWEVLGDNGCDSLDDSRYKLLVDKLSLIVCDNCRVGTCVLSEQVHELDELKEASVLFQVLLVGGPDGLKELLEDVKRGHLLCYC